MSAELQLVTDDIELVAVVGSLLSEVTTLRLVALADAGESDAETPPIVLVDVRKNITPASIRRLRIRHRRALFVAIVAAQQGPRELYIEGAHAVVPADSRAIAVCLSVLFQGPRLEPATRATAIR
ncbi:MAG TPA: hypothetical protein VFV99_01130 [Kofleriaceae bacterium]|nr:hypothetical protein [Kofleriaceae bacterium]